MKKALTIGALAALLVIAATAMAATKTYKGAIKGDQESSVVLKVKGGDDERSVKSFVAKDFLISCNSGQARLESATITGQVKVNDKGTFQVTGSNDGQELKVDRQADRQAQREGHRALLGADAGRRREPGLRQPQARLERVALVGTGRRRVGGLVSRR